MVDTGATHNFMAIDEAVRLGVKWAKKDGWMKTTSLSHTYASVEFGVHTREGITVHDSNLRRKIRWDEAIKGEPTFLAMMKMEDEPKDVESIPQVIETVLEENKDVMPAKSSWSWERNHHPWRLIGWLQPNWRS
ncbi:hypothetical protein Bca101_027089 [Brassica carinata]